MEWVATTENEMEILRRNFYKKLDLSWDLHVKTGTISEELLKEVSASSLTLSQRSRELVNTIYPYCGLDAARVETTINQVWRNINTASQHTLLVEV